MGGEGLRPLAHGVEGAVAHHDVAHDDADHLPGREPQAPVIFGQVALEALVEADAGKEVVDDRQAPELLAHEVEGASPRARCGHVYHGIR